jgi:hypothetical protein
VKLLVNACPIEENFTVATVIESSKYLGHYFQEDRSHHLFSNLSYYNPMNHGISNSVFLLLTICSTRKETVA